MRYVLTLTFLFLTSVVSNAQTASYSLPVPAPTTPLAVKFDSYGATSPGGEKARLRRFAAELKKEEYGLRYAQGHIISYGGRRTYAGEALTRGERARRYLIERLGVEAGRLVVVDGGYRESWAIELYIVPPGAVPPVPAPTLAADGVHSRGVKRRKRRFNPPRLTSASSGRAKQRLS
jgi:hypothetical protein